MGHTLKPAPEAKSEFKLKQFQGIKGKLADIHGIDFGSNHSLSSQSAKGNPQSQSQKGSSEQFKENYSQQSVPKHMSTGAGLKPLPAPLE